MSWNVISALASVGALFFAWETVRETGRLRREERLGRLAELVGEVGLRAVRVKDGHEQRDYGMAQLRLTVALVASGESLPVCKAFADDDLQEETSTDAIVARTQAALDELRPFIRGTTATATASD